MLVINATGVLINLSKFVDFWFSVIGVGAMHELLKNTKPLGLIISILTFMPTKLTTSIWEKFLVLRVDKGGRGWMADFVLDQMSSSSGPFYE